MNSNITSGKMEEDFTVARICVNKLKSEIKNLINQNTTLDQARNEAKEKLTEADSELAKTRLQIQQVRICNFVGEDCFENLDPFND